MGVNQYALEYKEYMMSAKMGSYTWIRYMYPYLGIKKSISSTADFANLNSIWNCPAVKISPANEGKITLAYAAITFGGTDFKWRNPNNGAESIRPVKLQQITRPTRQMVFADSQSGHGSPGARDRGQYNLDSMTYFSFRHSKKTNLGMLAGQVELTDYMWTIWQDPGRYPVNAYLTNEDGIQLNRNGITNLEQVFW